MPDIGPDRLEAYLVIAGVLFVVGLYAAISRRNAIGALIGIELMLNSAALQFAAYGRFVPNAADPRGESAAVFVIVVAAAEAAVALAVLFAVYRRTRDIDLEQNRELRS